MFTPSQESDRTSRTEECSETTVYRTNTRHSVDAWLERAAH